ncbi:MAG: guanylate kinase, partial [Clostridia bacterium]|nr:guanylate kinase [Clostridia bacterium]
AEYNGNIYGTPLPPIDAWLAEGKNVILEIEVQGAEKVMQKCPDALSVFIVPPSFEELERRLRGRGTETEENVVRRLAAALTEIPVAKLYQHIICNDTLSDAVKRLDALVDGNM